MHAANQRIEGIAQLGAGSVKVGNRLDVVFSCLSAGRDRRFAISVKSMTFQRTRKA